MFNSVILLMLITAVVGPLITKSAATSLSLQKGFDETEQLDWLPPPSEIPDSFSVVVPVYNPNNERSLIELAAAVAQHTNGRLIPLAVALAQPQMNSPQLTKALVRSRRLLEAAKDIGEEFEVTIEPELRIDYNIAQTIAHVGREKSANLIVLGMNKQAKLGNKRLFSNIQDEVMQTAHCPVVVARLLTPVSTIKTILIPIEYPSVMTLRLLRFAQVLAVTNQAKITLLHVYSPRLSKTSQIQLKKQMESLVDRLPPADCSIKIELLARDNVALAIAKVARQHDLVVVRSQRRRGSNSLTIGANDTPLLQQILQQIQGSIVLVGEPQLSNWVSTRKDTASKLATVS